MEIKSVQSTTPSFNARLRIVPKCTYEDLPLNDIQLKCLKSKFEQSTNDIKGTLHLALGQYNSYNNFCTSPSRITYVNKEYKDSIPIIIEPQSLITKDEFVDKLVKMLEIFKFREKNAKKVQQMEQRMKDLEQSTRASSLGAIETLFKIPEWRNNKGIK